MNKNAIIPSIVVLLAGAAPAVAHTGHGFAFNDGLTHPVSGFDHLLAMVAVGFWATTIGRRAMFVMPAVFVVAMVLGALAAYGGMPGLPATEFIIVLSLLILGAAIAMRASPPLWLASSITALFALAHGQAHGLEVAPDANIGLFVAGFAASTALLHAAGVLMASSLQRHQWSAQAFGGLLTVMGAAFLVA